MKRVRPRSPANLASLATASRGRASACQVVNPAPTHRMTRRTAQITRRTAQLETAPSEALTGRIFPRLPPARVWAWQSFSTPEPEPGPNEPEFPYGYQNLKACWLSEACDPLGAN